MWKIANKNTANGYFPLDQNVLVPINNIPNLSFSSLSNFYIVSPSNDQLIYYNSSNGLWENTNINSSFLNDFNISSPSTNQVLQYVSGKCTNSTLSFTSTLSGDTDVSISSPSTNQLLMYNGSKWANNTMTLEQNVMSLYHH